MDVIIEIILTINNLKIIIYYSRLLIFWSNNILEKLNSLFKSLNTNHQGNKL